MNWTEIKDLLIVAQILITAGVVIWMKFFYSELKQRDIKIDHLTTIEQGQ